MAYLCRAILIINIEKQEQTGKAIRVKEGIQTYLGAVRAIRVAAKFALVVLSRLFPWAQVAGDCQAEHIRSPAPIGISTVRRWKSRALGRLPRPQNLRLLIITMAEKSNLG
jgi:hypothetical protein